MAKVKVIVKDESGNEVPFFTKTLTKLFKGKAGKKYNFSVEEPNKPAVVIGDYTVQGEVIPDPHACNEKEHWDEAQQKCIPDDVTPPSHECPDKQHWDEQLQQCVDDVVVPPSGDVLYDSHIHSKLHDSNVRTIADAEGEVTPNGLGIEMHASGNPKVVVNDDGTFSLICGVGHGRFYGYVLNYNVILEIEAAFWNEAEGQDLSLKVRSDHNEGPDNRPDAQSWADVHGDAFGGYGLSIDRVEYDAKREPEHNFHDQAKSGPLPTKPKTKEYFTLKFTVMDQGDAVRQIGEINGQVFMNKIDTDPKPWMKDPAIYAKQSYYWVRSNIDKGSGELRIKRLRILKA